MWKEARELYMLFTIYSKAGCYEKVHSYFVTQLCIIISNGSPACLLKQSCVYTQDQYTPLFTAAARGFNEVVKSLIAANANVNCICKVSYYSYV